MGGSHRHAHAHDERLTILCWCKLCLTLCALCSAALSCMTILAEVVRKAYAYRARCCMQVMQEVGQEVEGYMTIIFNKDDRPDKDAEVVFLTKFIVTPDIALDFITEVKKVRELLVCVYEAADADMHIPARVLAPEDIHDESR